MLPHERSLVKRLADMPFALLGVSADRKETYRESVKNEPIPFRSWLDDESRVIGPTDDVGFFRGAIASRWNVTAWPTLYLLDAQGVIRFKWLGASDDKELDNAVESLLDELETKQR